WRFHARSYPYRHYRSRGGRLEPGGGHASRRSVAVAGRPIGVDRCAGPTDPRSSAGVLTQQPLPRRRDIAHLCPNPLSSPTPTMTPEQRQLVAALWKQVAPMAEAAADMFYRRLFEIHPATRKLFRATEMVAQRKKLVQMLNFAVNGLDRLDVLTSKVEDLG